jgi:large subunit ribosomal protein L31e
MATLERVYIIPLRREWLKTQKYKRAKKAVTGVKYFLMRHMKAKLDMVKLGPELNEEIWKHGMKNPPSRVKVNVIKDDKGLVTAELFGFEMPKKKEEKPKKEERTGIAAKLAEKLAGKEKPAKKEDAKKPEAKPAPAVKPAMTKSVAAAKPAEKKV